MELPGRYRLVGIRNLTLFAEEFSASQNRRLRESRCGGDLSEAPTVTVSGTTKALLAYVWPVGDDGDAGWSFCVPPEVPAAAPQAVSASAAAATPAARLSRILMAGFLRFRRPPVGRSGSTLSSASRP